MLLSVAPNSAPASSGIVADADRLWRAIIPRVQAARPLIATWVKMGTQLDFKGGVIKIGFPTVEAHSRDSLLRDATRRFLEDLLAEAAGQAVKLDLVVDPTLAPPPADEPDMFSAPAATPARAPVSAPAPAPAPAAPPSTPAPAAAPANDGGAGKDLGDDFYNDPLIKAALETFKAKIVK